jgi:hypothetical protein
MPSQPVILDVNCIIVGDEPYSGAGIADISTWAKTRCAAIIDPSPGTGSFGYSVGSNSLIIDEGFHPTDCYLFRVREWPYQDTWQDGSSNTITGHYGPHLGFTDVGSPAVSYISIGGYDVPDSSVPAYAVGYTPYDNFLDENDCANFWEGRLVNSAYTTDADFCNSDRTTNLTNNGQNIGTIGGFGGYGSISDMTAF